MVMFRAPDGSLYEDFRIDIDQVVFALERAERRLQHEADQLGRRMDYSAEIPAEDAQRMREAIQLLRQSQAAGSVR